MTSSSIIFYSLVSQFTADKDLNLNYQQAPK